MSERVDVVSKVDGVIDADARVSDVLAPTSAHDAANKEYVDNVKPWLDFTAAMAVKVNTQGVVVSSSIKSARYRILPGNVVACIITVEFTVGAANVDMIEILLPFDTERDAVIAAFATYDTKNEVQNVIVTGTALYIQRVVAGDYTAFAANKVNRTDIQFIIEHKPA